ncbi:MAG: peptidase M16, partial [Candidatus Cloacimonetes bacterium]|nr:peptidase M16 [Candidatus Cloacimonadota bacterium]
NVQYVAKGGNFFRKGYSYTGKLRVLNNILENEYLYQNIRVQGGAYGAFSGFELNGYQYFCSYRDPNLDNTLLVYDNAGDFIRNFKCSKWEFDRYIIGVISDLDYPFSPETKAGISDSDFITDFKAEDRQQIRNEVLSTKLEDLAAYADMLDAIMTKNHYCAVGNEHQIKASAELFDNLTPLYE